MAALEVMAETLLTRFKGVPNVTLEDTTEWVKMSFIEHGYRPEQVVPTNREALVLLYAEADGTTQIALRTAYYFEYSDGSETIDKSMISDQYKAIADDLWERYYRKKAESSSTEGASNVRRMIRPDRS